MENRAAFILPSLGGGGAEKVVVNLVNELCENELLTVDLVLGQAEGKYIDLVDKRVNIINLHSPRMFKSVLKLKNYLKINKPGVVISGLDYVNVITLIARRLAGVNTKVLVTEHNTLSQIIKYNNSLKTKFLVKAMKILYKEADKVIAVSNGVAADLSEILRLPPTNINVIYNPVINDSILEKANLEVTHSWLKEKRNPVIVAIGRLTVQKDFSTLIEAFRIVKNDIDAKLIILGEGDLRNSLEEKVAALNLTDSVDLHGFTPNPYAFLKHSDLFVLSSKWEGLPTVLIEALACGANIVSTDCKSGPSEILNNGEFGGLVQVGDIESLALEMKKRLTAKETSENHELKVWLKQFEAKEIMNEYQNLIKQFLI